MKGIKIQREKPRDGKRQKAVRKRRTVALDFPFKRRGPSQEEDKINV